MTQLRPGNPLLEELSQRSLPHHKHRILLFMLYYELLHGLDPVSTKQVSEECEIDYNVANQTMIRMQNYGLLKSKKGITTTYVIEDVSSETGRITVIRNDEKIPEWLKFENLIIEKKRKRVVHWYLNNESRSYAKYIWFNPEKYKVNEFLNHLIVDLLTTNKDNDYMDLLLEEFDYKEVKDHDEIVNHTGNTSIVKPIYRTPNIGKYARILAAEHFRDLGYFVVEFDYMLFDCDLEIMRNFEHNKVIVKGVDYQENKLKLMNSELDLLKDETDDYILCIVKFILDGNPIITEISNYNWF